jgi:serine/threonine protein kinase
MVGDKVDPQSDVYSVGALLHYMLTAHPVNRGGPRPPRDLIPIIDKATREERRDRYPRAASMRLALEANGAPLSVVPPPLPNPAPDAPNLVDEDVLPLDFSQPIRPEPTQDSPALPRWVAALAFVIGLGAAVAGGAWVFGGDAGADADPPTTATATAAETETETATETQTSTETETDPETETTMGTETETETETDEPPLALSTRTDLLSGDLPPPLEVLFPRVVAGEALSTRERHLVERYASEHREDPRPHILLARDFMARGWSSDTIARYREAFAVDPECRADARMLSDLLDLSTRQTSGPSAAQAVARIYGRDALLDVEAMLGGELEGGARRRLEQLQAQLSSL